MSALTKHRGLQVAAASLLRGSTIVANSNILQTAIGPITARQAGDFLVCIEGVLSAGAAIGSDSDWTQTYAANSISDYGVANRRTATATSTDDYNPGGTAGFTGIAYMVAIAAKAGFTVTPSGTPGATGFGLGRNGGGATATASVGSQTAPGAGYDIIVATCQSSGGGVAAAPTFVTPAGFTPIDYKGGSIGTQYVAGTVFMRPIAAGATGTASVEGDAIGGAGAHTLVLAARYLLT